MCSWMWLSLHDFDITSKMTFTSWGLVVVLMAIFSVTNPFMSLADSVEDDFELSTVCHRPESMDKLEEQTKFTKKELQVLYRGFKNVGFHCSLIFSATFKYVSIFIFLLFFIRSVRVEWWMRRTLKTFTPSSFLREVSSTFYSAI